jgi:hypothetical protein
MGLDSISPEHLKDIGLDAAREVVGEGRAREIEVAVDLDSTNEPACFFSFLIEQDGDPMRAALQRTRLGQRIRDKLIDRGDERYPYIRVLGHKDWGKRLGD